MESTFSCYGCGSDVSEVTTSVFLSIAKVVEASVKEVVVASDSLSSTSLNLLPCEPFKRLAIKVGYIIML